MRIKAIAVIGLLLISSLALVSCAQVSQEDYDSVVSQLGAAEAQMANLKSDIANLEDDWDAAQDEITNLEIVIENLNSRIELLTSTAPIEEAWDIAEQRYTTLRDYLEFDIVAMAPWLEMPDRPTNWIDYYDISSVALSVPPSDYEAICIIKPPGSGERCVACTPGRQIVARLFENDEVTSMTFEVGSQDYEITSTRDENGKIVRTLMTAGESWCDLNWRVLDSTEFLTVQVGSKLESFRWSEDPDEFENILSDIMAWLEAIDKTGGLTESADQPLMLLALGELSKPPRTEFMVDWSSVARRIVIDVFCGIPASCLY